MLIQKDGVAKISIWEKDYILSYMNDVPMIILKKVIDVLSKKEDATATILMGEDGNEYIIVFSNFSSIIIEDATGKTYINNTSLKEIAKELKYDITKDIDGWADFIPNLSPQQMNNDEKEKHQEELKLRKKQLLDYCQQIEKLE